MSDRTQDHWTSARTHMVGKTYGQSTAPENRWHGRRRLRSSIPPLLCQHTAAESNSKDEQRRAQRPQNPGGTRHPNHTHHEGS